MFEISERSKLKEILLFINSLARYEIAAIAVYISNNYGLRIASYASKEEMLRSLKGLDKEVLLEAIDTILGSDDCEDDSDDDESDSDFEDSDEDESEDGEDEDSEEDED